MSKTFEPIATTLVAGIPKMEMPSSLRNLKLNLRFTYERFCVLCCAKLPLFDVSGGVDNLPGSFDVAFQAEVQQRCPANGY